MGLSFHLAALKGLRKKKVRSKSDEFEGPRKKRRAMIEPDSKACGYENITEDLLLEILVKLPAKQVTRAVCVSQLWYSVISSSYFTYSILESQSSSKRPRLLISLVDKEDQNRYAFFSSTSINDRGDTSNIRRNSEYAGTRRLLRECSSRLDLCQTWEQSANL